MWPLHSFALSLVPPPSLSSFPSAGRWRLYCQKTITLTDVIYLPIISIIHITLISSLFLCPSPSVPLPSPPNFFLLFILLNFFPLSILALSPFLSPTFLCMSLVGGWEAIRRESWAYSNAVSVSQLADEATPRTETHVHQYMSKHILWYRLRQQVI